MGRVPPSATSRRTPRPAKRARAEAEPQPDRRETVHEPVESLAHLIARVRAWTIPVPDGVRRDALLAALEALDAMVGAAAIKTRVCDMVLLACLGLHDAEAFTNVVLTGNPGTGKTEMLGVLSELWRVIFYPRRGGVTWLCRAALVGEHLGETAVKTATALAGAAPGVVVLDEVYSLGAGCSSQRGDSFAKECVDTLNQFVSECRDQVSVIAAGYAQDVDECFFAQNRGLERRFPWRFHIDDYTPAELARIAEIQLRRSGWSAGRAWTSAPCVAETLGRATNNGGDTERLIHLCKMAHARRVPRPCELRFLSEADVAAACAAFAEPKPRAPDAFAAMYT
jgi:hypothetical protein